MNEKELVRDYKDIAKEYRFNADVFSSDKERVAKVKWIVEHRLTEADRIIIILYADCQSLRKLGRRLGISHSTLALEVNRIKAQILTEYEKLK